MTTYKINGKTVGPTGYGLMGFTWVPGVRVSEEQAFTALTNAIENGQTLWNTAEFYGRPVGEDNLDMIASYFTKYPEASEKVLLTIKGGMNVSTWAPVDDVNYLRTSVDNITKHLKGTHKLDMFILARVNPKIPIEDSVRVMKELLDEGKIGSIGLSEVGAESIRKAAKIAPIAAVEIEFSLWEREAERIGVIATCKELGIPVIAYSPNGKGLLTGKLDRTQLAKDDVRLMFERFDDQNAAHNQQVVDKVTEIAKSHKCTNAQVCLSWIRQVSNTGKYPVIVPIPGTTKPERVIENGDHVQLSDADMKEIDGFFDDFKLAGSRYNSHIDHLNWA